MKKHLQNFSLGRLARLALSLCLVMVMTIGAVWAQTKTVYFYVDQGTLVPNSDFPYTEPIYPGVYSYSIESGSVVLLPSATREGYTFDGWSMSENGSVIGGYLNVSSNFYLYARFTQNSGVSTTEPSITVATSTINFDDEDHDGTLDITFENLNININSNWPEIQFYDETGAEISMPAWIYVLATPQDPNTGTGCVVSYYMEETTGTEPRTTYFKVYAMDDQYNLVYSNLVTFTQEAPAPITVTPRIVYAPNTDSYPILSIDYGNLYFTSTPEVRFFEADGTTPATYNWLEVELSDYYGYIYGDVTINSNPGIDRTAYIRVYVLDDDDNWAYSNLVTINQESADCPAPGNLTMEEGSLSFNGATFTWTGYPGNQNYDVYIGEADVTTILDADFDVTIEDYSPYYLYHLISNNFSFTPIPYGYISSYNTDAGSTASVEYEDLWVEADPVVISFKAKITSDEVNKGSFWIDGVKKLELSGNSDWTEYSYEISDYGYHTLEWKYVRENDNEGGYYSFYLDDIRIKEYSPNSMSYVTTTTDPTYTFNNLDPETTYLVNVESYCGSDGYSQTSNTVLFTTASQCQNPDHVTATDVTPTSAHISWYSYGHTEAVVEYSMDPYFSGGYDIYSVIVNDADSVTLTGLTPNSWYGVRVKTYCDDDNDPSTDPMEIISETIEIVTPCDYIPIPYFEDFENYSSNLSCWTLYDNITTSDPYECPTQYRQYTKTVTEYYPEQNEYLEFRSHNNTDNPNIPCEYGYDDLYAVLPPAHDVNTLRIRMMAKLGGDTWVFPLSIGVMTDPNDLSTYQGVGFINIESHMNYAEYTFDFANYTGTGEYIALRMPYAKTDSNHVRILCVDSVTVESNVATQYTVDVLANPNVGGTVTGGGTYDAGDQVTVSAVPAAGYIFMYWRDWSEGTVMSYEPSYTFTVNQDVTLGANFRVAYTVSFDAGTGNCETASITETNDNGIILPAATTTCEGWTFAGWTTTPVDESIMTPNPLYHAGDRIYTDADKTLYAVYSSQSVVEGYYKTSSIEYGDEVCLVHEENILSHTHNIGGQEFAGISNTYPPRGIGQEYDRLPQGVYVYTVEVGSRGNGFVAFKHGNSYLNWRHDPTSLMDNHLNEEDSLSENTSWIVSFDDNGNANIVNDASYLAAYGTDWADVHKIRWDKANTRFTCYLSAVDEGYDPVQLYKHGTATIGLYNSNPCMVTCEEITALPYTRDFEENVPVSAPTPKTRIMPQCVTIAHEYVTLSDTTKPQLYHGHTYTESSNYSMYLCGRGIYALPQYLVEDQEGRPVRMSFYLTQTKCKHQLQVGVMTDLTDESSFTPVITLDNGCSAEVQYCDFELAANSAALNGKYIAFKNIINPAYTSESRSYNWIDDLEINFGEPQAVIVCEINHTYTEDFENITSNNSTSTGIQPECWRKAGAVTGMTTTDPQVSYNSNGNGSYNLYMSGKSIIVMPEYVDDDVALNTLEMSLKVRQKKFAHELEVGVMTDPTDESTFELVAVINNGNTTTLLPCAVDFTTYEGTGRYIAFRNTVKSGYTSTYSYNWIDDISFSVKQAEVCGIEIRYEEDFDDMTTQTSNLTGEQPQCWTLASGTELASNVLPQLACNSTYAGSGSYSLYLSGKCTYVMPEILTNVNVSDLRMSLTVRQRKFSHQLEVGVMTDPTDVSTFELVKVINNGDYTQPKANEVDFSEYTGQGKYIAFRNTIISGYTSTYSYNWIDDIVIDLATNFPTATTETMVEAVETEDAELDSNEDNNEEPFNAPNAINSFSVEQLSLYPNPTSGKLTIVADEVSMVEVYSQIGSKVATFTLNNEHVIDLGNLPKGVYILRVTMPEGVAVRKVVKN